MAWSTSIAVKGFAAAAVVVCASGSSLLSDGARAEVLARYRAELWDIEANGSGGGFSNCIMSLGSNARGVHVVMSLDKDGKWGVGVRNPAFNLRPGARGGSIAYWVHDVMPRGGSGVALDAKTLIVPLDNATQLFEEFRLGSTMNVKAGNETFHFSLNGTSTALAALSNCARRHTQEAQSPK